MRRFPRPCHLLLRPRLLGLLPLLAPLLAMSSPWWENYEIRERFLCPQRGAVVLERNDSQASLLSGRYRSTLFREAGATADLRYRNDDLRVILRGDVLTLEQLPLTFTCVRTEEV